ncbi:MAG: homoserine dehydrogenase, partial [Conexivisphaera sp.]
VIDRGGAVVHWKGVPYAEAAAAKDSRGTVSRAEHHGRPGATVLDVLEEVEADVYVDTTLPNFEDGQPSLSYIEKAMLRGMHVVTSNKAPLALAMPALLEIAGYKGVRLLYSGTVGGGTPFLGLASGSLRGNRIRAVRGVLNGTTNYVLYRMEREGASLEEALEEARRLGYAEADPTLDLSGMDAAAKLVILTNHATGSRYTLGDVRYSGIGRVTPGDLREAARRGKALRLIADSRGLRVGLEEVDAGSPLNVPANLNSVEFDVEELGSVYLIGRGAGGPETAAAVLRDLVQLNPLLPAGGH